MLAGVQRLLLDDLVGCGLGVVSVEHVGLRVDFSFLVEGLAGAMSVSLLLDNNIRLTWQSVHIFSSNYHWEFANVLE